MTVKIPVNQQFLTYSNQPVGHQEPYLSSVCFNFSSNTNDPKDTVIIKETHKELHCCMEAFLATETRDLLLKGPSPKKRSSQLHFHLTTADGSVAADCPSSVPVPLKKKNQPSVKLTANIREVKRDESL